MKLTSLLPLGVAILSTLPLTAQTTEPSTPPSPPEAPSAPKAPMTPETPIAPLPPLGNIQLLPELPAIDDELKMNDVEIDLDKMNWELDAMDFELDAKDFELDAKDFEIDAKDFELDAAMFEQIREGIILQMDSVQSQVREELRNMREKMRAERDLQRQIRATGREIRAKSRELRKMESQMSGDTETMRESIRQAEESLAAARASLAEITPQIERVQMVQIPRLAVSMGSDSGSGKEWHHVQVIDEGGAACSARSIAICRQSTLGPEGRTEMVFIGGDSTPATRTWTRHQRIRISTDDSVLTDHPELGGINLGSRVFIQHTNKDGEINNRTIFIRAFGEEGEPMVHFPALPQGEAAPLKLSNNLILVGDDSVRLQDGSDDQMMIRVYRDSSNAPNARTSVVVINISRQKKVDTLSGGGTSDAPRLQEMASAMDNSGYTLEANRPNPFSESTTINFEVPRQEHVNLTVFDATGKPVKVLKDEVIPAGSHSVSFNAEDLPSGIYLYRLVGGSFSETKTMTIAK